MLERWKISPFGNKSFLGLKLIDAWLIYIVILLSKYTWEKGKFSSAIVSDLISGFKSMPISNFYQMNPNSDEQYSIQNLKKSL